jgi:hypothetical protein
MGHRPPLVSLARDAKIVPAARCYASPPPTEICALPHQLCHFHYLREAAKPIYDADRHAKKELKKRVRGVRPIERRLEGRSDPEAAVVRGYCAAVRSALTDDGRPPLDASGLKLHGRLSAITASIERVEKRGACPRS